MSVTTAVRSIAGTIAALGASLSAAHAQDAGADGASDGAVGQAVGQALEHAVGEIRALREQNERLAAQVARLESRVAAGDDLWLTERRAEEIRTIVSDVLADASSRATLAADGATAGWDKSKGFYLASADGAFSLGIKGYVQVRWAYDAREIGTATAASGSPSNTTPDDAWGFEIRRARLSFFGNVVDPSWYYELQFEFARSGGTATILDAFVEKRFDDGWNLRLGQYKGPFLREELASSTGLLAVERSLVNAAFSAGRVQGARVAWESESFRIEGFYGGEIPANDSAPYAVDSSGNPLPLNAGAARGIPGSQNTSFNAVPTDYAFIGRFEWKTGGTWKQYRDMQSFRGDAPGTLVGVAGYVQQVDPITNALGATPDVVWSATADLSVDLGGASILAYGVYRNVGLQQAQPVRGGGTSDSLDQWGAVVQGGYFLTDDLEAFVRYEAGSTDTDQFRTNATSLLADADSLALATIGANWWPAGSKNKQVKLSADFGYAFDPLVDFASSGANVLPDYTAANGATSDGQWVIRTQLQLSF